MTVKAWLEGHEFDLQDLADLLPSGDVRVIKDDQGYYLTAAEIDNPPDKVPVYEVAPRVLELVNGLGRVNRPDFRGVKLSGRYQEGERRHTVVGVASVECRARVSAVGVIIGPDGAVKPPPPPRGPRYVAVANTQPAIADALAIMASEKPLGWVDLSAARCTPIRRADPERCQAVYTDSATAPARTR